MKLTIELDEHYESLLRALAAKQGVDMAEMVRILIEDTQYEKYPEPSDPVLRAAEEDFRAGRVIPHDEVMRKIFARIDRDIAEDEAAAAAQQPAAASAQHR